MKQKSTQLTIIIIFALFAFSTMSCKPREEFEQFVDYAIELDSESLNLTYEVANSREYDLSILSGEKATIYPTGQITFIYTLTNTTDRNYRFTVCLFWEEFTNELGCDIVTFIGQSSVTLTHTVSLSPGSGQLWLQGTDILVEPIVNDVPPLYFSASLDVETACPSGETCCHYHPDGKCGQGIDPQKNQSCP
jgi:hypothetical protein